MILAIISLGILILSLLALYFKFKFKFISKLTASSAFSILLIELLFLFFGHSKTPSIEHIYQYSSDFRKSDHDLGYSIIENTEVNASLHILKENKKIYCYKNMTYTSDSKGRRVCIEGDRNSTKHAIFFGGSFLFGNGLHNHETLPSSFQFFNDHEYKAYNYGQSGHCASQMLIKLGKPHLFDDISLKDGCAFYVFIKGHLKRSSGYYTYIKHFPWYPTYGLENNRLSGPHYWLSGENKYKIQLKMRQFADECSYAGRYLVSNFFDTCLNSDQQIQANIQIIEHSKKHYNRIFPNNPLIVVNWPRSGVSGDLENLLAKELNDKGIPFFTPEPLSNIEKAKIHQYDDHPSKDEVKWVAKQLTEYTRELDHLPVR